jgi:phage/plasmid-like protein (TIGR03299 family)
MAHDLAIIDARASMMYVGTKPWHGLGVELGAPATAAEAIQAAGLDYDVELAPLCTRDGIPVPLRKAVVRCDTQEALGVVGNNYVPIQNRDCFNFLDAVVADGGLRYHTAGALKRGERIWLLAKLPDHIQVRGTDDIVDRYLLLSNAHDGSASLRCFFTPVRVVCANTLTLAHNRGRGEGIAICHVGDLAGKVRQAQEVLGLARKFYDNLEDQINALANHYPTSAQLTRYFESLYPDPVEGSNSRARNAREELFRLFERGLGNDVPGVRHTTWAAYNALTEFVDHHRSARGSDPEERSSNRLASIWFGSGAHLKARAFDHALQMAQSN